MTENIERITHTWIGYISENSLTDEAVRDCHLIANAGKSGEWETLLALLEESPDFVNSVRLNGKSLFTPLHQAAYNGAPELVVRKLIGMGAFRTLTSAQGERPVDIAKKNGHKHLVRILEPEIRTAVDLSMLPCVQEMFHGLIRAAMVAYGVKEQLRLPELIVLTEFDGHAMWFPVPGMYGGFSFWLNDRSDSGVSIIAESWCRVSGGSGMRHRITPFEIILEEEGFV